MKINGFQKMTLLDFPGKIACTVFTAGCNLRCPFCHNALLVVNADELEEIPEEEVFSYLKKRQGILEGVAVTGGEPLIRKDIGDFLRRVKDLGYQVKLDTNGFFPDVLKNLVSQGLVDYVAVDIKNSREKYPETTGITGLDITPLCESVKYLMEGHVPYEFRTTCTEEFHTEEDIRNIGEWIRGADRWFLQKFVDSGNLIGDGLHAVSKEGMAGFQRIAAAYVGSAAVRGE